MLDSIANGMALDYLRRWADLLGNETNRYSMTYRVSTISTVPQAAGSEERTMWLRSDFRAPGKPVLSS